MEETMQVDDFGSTSAFVSQAPVQSADSGNIPSKPQRAALWDHLIANSIVVL